MKKIANLLLKYRFILITVTVFLLFGFSLWKLQSISNPQPDPAYLEQKRQNLPTKIEIKDSLRSSLENLENTPVDTQSENIGQGDPFNP